MYSRSGWKHNIVAYFDKVESNNLINTHDWSTGKCTELLREALTLEMLPIYMTQTKIYKTIKFTEKLLRY